ncbi:hypothetical protein UFOVP972_213 [uncultured Caudovirales phage]|uniref:Uncharacterized protein n=1 Tax=uncultured Caudovirales phage TaxID=2100421 RepID=A0A6J5Q7D0_9CAUD|nr:hypothetical protein UFOVP972_213 [uncultured Caudovirales phage]
MGRRMTVYKEVDVEIEFDDVMDYITDYATEAELDDIREEIKLGDAIEFDNGLDGSFIREEKLTLMNLAINKYTLEELEQRLGTKFDLR